MAAIDGIEIPSLLLAEQASAPTTPASGFGRLYAKSTGLFFVGDDGVEVGPLGTGSGGGGVPVAAGCRLTKSANQSTAAGPAVAITFNGEAFDTDAFHDNATNNSRITIPAGKGGQYMAGGSMQWDASSAGGQLNVRVNGTTTLPGDRRETGTDGLGTSILVNVVAGDYLELMVISGNTNAVRGGTGGGVDATFWATRIGS